MDIENLKLHYTSNQYSRELTSGVLTWRHKTGVSSVFESRYFDCDNTNRRRNQGYSYDLNYLAEHLQYLIGQRPDYYKYSLRRSTSYVNGRHDREYSTDIEFLHVFESDNSEDKPRLTLVKWFEQGLYITNTVQFKNNKYSMNIDLNNYISVEDFTEWLLQQETLEF